MTIRRMVVKDLLLNTVLTAKHHLGLLLFLSHRKEQTNDVTVYYNKRRNGYLCDFFFRSNPFCAIFDAYKRRKMHWNTNEICRCFLQDIGHNIAIVFGYRQFVSRFFLLTIVCTSNPFFKLAKKIKVHLIWTLTCKKKINEDHNIRQYMIFF